MEIETILNSHSPDASLPVFQVTEQKQNKLSGYVTNYLRGMGAKSVTFVNENMKFIWRQLKEKMQETYESYYVWMYAYLIMYGWSEEDLDPLLEWVRSKAPGCSVTDFSTTWKNGLILVALVEGIVPNSCACAQYHILNPKHSVQNVELAFSIAKKYLGVSPTLYASEITSGNIANEKNLIRYITMLKLASVRRVNNPASPISLAPDQDPVFHGRPYLIKGMGILFAKKDNPARFNLYVKHLDQMDILIEIDGPNSDFCSHRITTKSPRNQTIHSKHVGRKFSDNSLAMNIEFEYEILGRKVSVTYWPVSKGIHQLNIYWQGKHVDGSPYLVRVIECENTDSSAKSSLELLPPTKRARASRSYTEGKIVQRRILRQVVIRNGKEVELEREKPLPNDPKAWCGASGQLEADSPEVDGGIQFKISPASPENSDSSDKSNIEVDCETPTFEPERMSISIQENSSENQSTLKRCRSCEDLQAFSLEEGTDCADRPKKFVVKRAKSPSNFDSIELPRNVQQPINLNGCFAFEPYIIEDLEDSFNPDVSPGILNRAFRGQDSLDSFRLSVSAIAQEDTIQDSYMTDFEFSSNGNSNISDVLYSTRIESTEPLVEDSSKFINVSPIEAQSEIEQENEEVSKMQFSISSLTNTNPDLPVSPNSIVKIRVQEWEETISKSSPNQY